MSAPLLTPAEFSEACRALPLVSMDLVITTANGEILLGKRNNAPARNYWFTPGGRIRKNEALDAAKTRIAHEELGLPFAVWERATLMGVWDHFYEESSFDPSVSTHYVNLPHWLEISDNEKRQLQLPQGPHAQHAHWRWANLADVESDTSIHPYARNNAQWVIEHRDGK